MDKFVLKYKKFNNLFNYLIVIIQYKNVQVYY
jgi:hypothetical protein